MGREQLRESSLGTFSTAESSQRRGTLLRVGSQPLSGCTCSPGTVGRQAQKTHSISEHQVRLMPHKLPRRGNRGQRERKYMPEGHMITGATKSCRMKTGWLQPHDLSSSSSSSFSLLPFLLLLVFPSQYPSSSTCSPFLFLCRCKVGHLETRGQPQVPFLRSCLLCFLSQGLPLAWDMPPPVGGLASKFQGTLPFLPLQCWDVDHHAQDFYKGSGD